MRKILLSLSSLLFVLCSYGQSIDNTAISFQKCQGDTLVFTFEITSPFNPGNEFTLEMSDQNGNFNGTEIHIAPLFEWAAPSGQLQLEGIVPDTA